MSFNTICFWQICHRVESITKAERNIYSARGIQNYFQKVLIFILDFRLKKFMQSLTRKQIQSNFFVVNERLNFVESLNNSGISEMLP